MENEFLKNTFGAFGDFFRRMGIRTWPALLMFVVVLSATAYLNYNTLSPIVGGFGAALIACFFGVGVLSWHAIEARTDDSKEQEGVANFVKWLNVILDATLLIVNLFRSENPLVLDWIAFAIIGISAASHVAGYLLWTEKDTRRKIRKDGERAISEIDKQRQSAENAIRAAGESLKFEKWLIDEEARLRAEYATLDPARVNEVVRVMQVEARKNFEKKSLPDAGKKQDNRPNSQGGG